jgi:hypothetical protein
MCPPGYSADGVRGFNGRNRPCGKTSRVLDAMPDRAKLRPSVQPFERRNRRGLKDADAPDLRHSRVSSSLVPPIDAAR